MKYLSPYQTDEYNAAVCRKTSFRAAKAALIARLRLKKKEIWRRCPINGYDYMVVCCQLADARRMKHPS